MLHITPPQRARVTNKIVKAAKARNDLLDHAFYCSVVTHVDLDGEGGAAKGAKLFSD